MKDELSGSVEAQMKSLGDYDGKPWYWAAPGRFTNPGLYYWDGKQNVRAFDVTAAPASQAGGAVDLATKMESWSGALINAEEILHNASDKRIIARAQWLISYLRENEPRLTPPSIDGASVTEAILDAGEAAYESYMASGNYSRRALVRRIITAALAVGGKEGDA